jgi:hypothetical protein
MVNVTTRPLLMTGPTTKFTVPLPIPELPEVIEIHGGIPAIVHPHCAEPVTWTDPVPPAGGNVALLELITNPAQDDACCVAAICATVVPWDVKLMVPERVDDPVFEETAKVAEPEPLTWVAEGSSIQLGV